MSVLYILLTYLFNDEYQDLTEYFAYRYNYGWVEVNPSALPMSFL